MPSLSQRGRKAIALAVALSLLPLAAGAADAPASGDKPLYLDPDRAFEARAADLVSRMTLEEKVSQMQNSAAAIPRLGVPAYDWWNEALHGVARAGGATVFPQAIAMAATFDAPLMHQIATTISDEARAKHHEFLRQDQHGRYQGLTFWSPNINIFRDPRWGRGQETYGEDPYLTSRMGVNFVQGLQGDDPKYRKVDATAKHFAVHSGPEHNRHEFDVHPDPRDLHETYLPAFQALVQEAHVDAVMGAYNRVNGESASASQLLLQDTLRRDWGFKGYVVSDCDSIEDIYKHHKIVGTAEEAAALGVKRGLELNCGRTYAALTGAVKQGLISEAEIDAAVRQLMTARMRLGMFDPPERVPYANIPYSVNQAPAHDALALRAARESLVLLKNDGVLPLSPSIRRVAVIGPTADDPMALLGNYYGTPANPVTVLKGIRNALPDAQVVYARGSDLVERREDPDADSPIEPRYLRPTALANERGLQGEYFRGKDLRGEPALTRLDSHVAFRWDRGAPTDDAVARGELSREKALASDDFSVRWTGQLLPPRDGVYDLSVTADDGFRLYLDGKLLLDRWKNSDRAQAQHASVALRSGQAYDLRLEYYDHERDAAVRLAWRLPGGAPPLEEALQAAREADAVIFVGGLTGDVEGEEMDVSYPGFSGGDRTDLRLPKPQRELLEALHGTGKPVVAVLTAGSALAIDWAQQHLPAILLAWYPGQRGGDAVADALFGKTSPGGRLPVTFYRADATLPAFDDYAMKGRTYRYYEDTPLYPFGFGLSYARFDYSALTLDRRRGKAGDPLQVKLKVRNSGKVAADEVVQLYLRPVNPARPRALKELRGFQRITLQPGEQREIAFDVQPERDLRIYDPQRQAYLVDAGQYEVQVGASSADIRLKQSYTVTD
ncbi:glycoside hydrolase family 3 C-terminal domain-containing protein [Stenotrophomonas sp. HITSZ_GD]|uniref:glycoside hydrolase family 3 C-terminal domain-containing protein n=1 Tax=Stenotrophomonas sp. HITSZ_GD TaxID=3037248 RepID=UPI00240D13F1|nr:glycoside hydrolase family 3 C-terminal domain-containing protein [Stenotrophomonas sp. HITSZ_GD]MDG2524281.1 glycoside hydrolase family 3 C-terminal domain-containing protein [Stenotrophomonas sp. HITSZ_GD]